MGVARGRNCEQVPCDMRSHGSTMVSSRGQAHAEGRRRLRPHQPGVRRRGRGRGCQAALAALGRRSGAAPSALRAPVNVILCIIVYYMADSPDQPQLKTQKCTNVACELKTYTLSIEHT